MITNSTLIRNLRKSLKLSRKQEFILIGTLLGDGSLLSNSWGKNYRLSLRQGALQKEYLFWKYNIFKTWKDNLRLKSSLERIYKIKVLIIKDHGKPRLYISGKNDIRKFLSIIKPYCLKLFDYKFP